MDKLSKEDIHPLFGIRALSDIVLECTHKERESTSDSSRKDISKLNKRKIDKKVRKQTFKHI